MRRSVAVGGAAVHLDDGAVGEARGVGRQVQRRADNFLRRSNGTSAVIAACTSSVHALAMSIRNGPGMMQLQRTFGPKVCARHCVRLLRPALAAAYGSSIALGATAAILLTLTIEPPSPLADDRA